MGNDDPRPTEHSALSAECSVELSVVIPAYNEAAILGETIARVAAYLEASGQHELLVVDDGSRDATAAIVEACAEQRWHSVCPAPAPLLLHLSALPDRPCLHCHRQPAAAPERDRHAVWLQGI